MGFVEGKIEGEKVFGGKLFPKTLNPPFEGVYGADELVEMVKKEREWLYEVLEKHSAILFRGFGLKSAEDFGSVVEAFGWEEMPYWAPGSRPKVVGRVYTANEAPPHQFINFHHEMAVVKKSPAKIFFFCLEPSPEGGETSILPSQVIVDQMEERVPEFVSKLSTLGFIHRINMIKEEDSNLVISKTWKSFLGTQDEAEAERRAKEKLVCSEVKFKEDGSAEIVFGPLKPVRKYGGRRVWFNTIVNYTSADVGNISFADGSQLPESAVEAYKKITEDNCVDIKWQKGDLLLLDNLHSQHARRPGKPPRAILVSYIKSENDD